MRTLIFVLFFTPLSMRAQETQLAECQQKAVQHFPLIKEKLKKKSKRSTPQKEAVKKQNRVQTIVQVCGRIKGL